MPAGGVPGSCWGKSRLKMPKVCPGFCLELAHRSACCAVGGAMIVGGAGAACVLGCDLSHADLHTGATGMTGRCPVVTASHSKGCDHCTTAVLLVPPVCRALQSKSCRAKAVGDIHRSFACGLLSGHRSCVRLPWCKLAALLPTAHPLLLPCPGQAPSSLTVSSMDCCT